MVNNIIKHKICAEMADSNASRYLLGLLIDLADSKGSFIMSIKGLSEITGYTPPTITRNMGILKQKNAIKIIHRYTEDGGRASNKYVLNLG